MTAAYLAAPACGSLAGTLLFTASMRWVWLAAEAWSQAARIAGGRPPPPRVALTIAARSLFYSGPWLAMGAAFFARHVRSEPWAPWMLGGALASIAFLGYVTFIATANLRKARAARDAGEAQR